jgi:hypothetical protein
MAKNIRSLEEILHFGPQIGDTEELIAKLENKLDARLDPVHRDFLLRFGSVTIFGEWAFSNAEAIAKDPHGTFGVYVDYPPPWERIDLPASSSIAELICIAGGGNAEMMGWHPKRREFFIFETCPDTLISCGSSFISGFNALLDTNEGFAPRDFWPI